MKYRWIMAVVCASIMMVEPASAAKKKGKAFKKLDTDKNGTLSLAEFTASPKKEGRSDKEHQKKQKKMFGKRDIDGDKALCQEEFELILSGKKANVDEYRAKLANNSGKTTSKKKNKVATKSKANSKAKAEAEAERKRQEALAEQERIRKQKEFLERQRAAGVVVCDTRVVTSKGEFVGRLSEKTAANDLVLECFPGVYMTVAAADVETVKDVPVGDACNFHARQKLGM